MLPIFLETLKIQPLWIKTIFLLEFLSFFKKSISILKWVYTNFFRKSKNLKKYVSWALVTVSTDGIGKALSFELAKKGLNLILIGRNPSKLEAVKNEILSRFEKTQVKLVVFDFSSDLNNVIKRISEVINGLDVGILINNAGVFL